MARPIINAAKVAALWARPKARAEIRKRVKARLGIDVETLRDLLELFVEYAPELLRIIGEVVRLFS